MSEATLEKAYKVVLQLQERVNLVQADVDTLVENDKTLSDHINKVSKAVQSAGQDNEAQAGGANITVSTVSSPFVIANSTVVVQQQSNPSKMAVFSWEQMMEDTEDHPLIRTYKCRDGVRFITVLAPTKKYLKRAFKTLSNTEKKQLRNQFTAPDLPLTLTPRLWEAECSKGMKSPD